MRIAIYHNLPSGGAKRSVYEQIKGLSKNHEIDIYTTSIANQDFCNPKDYVNRTYVFNYPTIKFLFKRPLGRLNNGILFLILFRFIKLQEQIAAQINNNGYDVVLVHPCQIFSSPPLLSHLEIPTVYYCHEPLRRFYEPEIYRAYIRKNHQILGMLIEHYVKINDINAIQAADSVITNSFFTAESIYKAYGINASVCYHGVDDKLFQPLFLEKKNYLLSVGAIRVDKGFDFLIRSIACLEKNERPDLMIIGNEDNQLEKDFLISLARDLGVRLSININARVEELIKAYNECRLVVYAPVLEPFGFVPLEAMACSQPVLGVSEGGLRETIITNQTGVLTSRNELEYATSLKNLLSQPDYLNWMGSNGRKLVESNWKWEDATKNLEIRINTAIEAGKGIQ